MAGLAALQASVAIITFSYKAARHIGAEIGWKGQAIAAVESRLDRLSMLLEHHGLATCTSPAIKLALRDLVLDLAAIAAIWRKAMKLKEESAWTNFWATKDNYAAALDRLSRSVDDLTLFIVVDIHEVVTAPARQAPTDDQGADVDVDVDVDDADDKMLSQHADALVSHLHDLVDDLHNDERFKAFITTKKQGGNKEESAAADKLNATVESMVKVLPSPSPSAASGPPAPQPAEPDHEPLPGLPFPNAKFVLSVSSAQESSYIPLSSCFEGGTGSSSQVTFVDSSLRRQPATESPGPARAEGAAKASARAQFRFHMELELTSTNSKAVGCGALFGSYDKDMTLVPKGKGFIFFAKETMVNGQIGFELKRRYSMFGRRGPVYHQTVVLRRDKHGNPRLQAASSWRRNEVAHFVCSPAEPEQKNAAAKDVDIVLRANQIVSENGRDAAATRYDKLADLATKVVDSGTGHGRSARAFLAGLMAKAAPAAGVVSPAIDCAATLKEIFK